MRLDVDSGIVNGALNIYELHVRKRRLPLSAFSMGGLLDQGLSTKWIHGMSACIYAVVITLVTVGAFSIVGLTEPRFKITEMKNLVRLVSTEEEQFNFQSHIFLQSGRVSRAIPLLMSHDYCTKSTVKRHRVYQFVSNLTDIAGLHLSGFGHKIATTCLTSTSGFSDQIAISLDQWHPPNEFIAEFRSTCGMVFNLATIPYWKVSATHVHQERSCRFPVLEGWCVRTTTVRLNCAFLVRVPEGYAVVEYGTVPKPGYSSCFPYRVRNRPKSQQLKSMVLLAAADTDDPLLICHRFLTTYLTIERNAEVQRRVGDLSYVEVDVMFFCLTTGIAALIAMCTGFVAWFLWLRILVLPKRLDYNRFNSSYELLCYAASYATGDEDLRFFHVRNIAVGISKLMPHVGPLTEADFEGGEIFNEEELVGRCN